VAPAPDPGPPPELPPDLARELQKNPRLLEGQEREITALFADIRGFSRLAERLGPKDLVALVADVMDRLTARVLEFDGVLVTYLGDGLLAMWNAPADRPDHAALACRAALAMLGDLPALSAGWAGVVGEPLGVGVGINSGKALVGNTGSRYKFHYGPLGHAVNVAGRVQGATKHLRLPALITASTRTLVGDHFATRRVGRVRLFGVHEPVELYELAGPDRGDEWRALREAYEAALGRFEAGEFAAALGTLAPLVTAPAGLLDLPSSQLMTRALECLHRPPAAFDPVLELTSK
jgi:adenylate cyclase